MHKNKAAVWKWELYCVNNLHKAFLTNCFWINVPCILQRFPKPNDINWNSKLLAHNFKRNVILYYFLVYEISKETEPTNTWKEYRH
jgi:hypothetical protein